MKNLTRKVIEQKVETKREGQRKAKRQRAHMNPKNKRERASPSCGLLLGRQLCDINGYIRNESTLT
jgi:hypothetical protein